jgi:hypothetical protein
MDTKPPAPDPGEAPADGTGAERRNPERPDRRVAPRGGRRATDAFTRVARFVYDLLTEPPK